MCQHGELKPLLKASRASETVTLDFIIGLPPSLWGGKVYNAILIVVNTFTKWSLYIPCRKDINGEEFAELFFRQAVANWGIAAAIVSYGGSLFISKFWSTLCWDLGVKRKLLITYSRRLKARQSDRTKRRGTISAAWYRLVRMVEFDGS
jgi:hypothetical protein